MRKIVLHFSVSLDGYMEGLHHDISWHLVDDEQHRHINTYLASMGGFLSGRVTHQLMAEFWPTADQDPSIPPAMAEFAEIWREMPKIMFSRTVETSDWHTTTMRSVDVQAITALKADPGGDLVLGGADLAATFRELDLIDEYYLYLNPVLVGAGTPLFRQLDTRTDLHLLETRTFDNGVVLLRYERPQPAADPAEK